MRCVTVSLRLAKAETRVSLTFEYLTDPRNARLVALRIKYEGFACLLRISPGIPPRAAPTTRSS